MRLNVNIGPEPALNLGLAYLLSGRYADAVRLLEAARIALSRLSDARLPAGRAPTPSSAATTTRRMRSSRASARIRTSTSQASARASRTRRCKRRLEQSLRKAGLN